MSSGSEAGSVIKSQKLFKKNTDSPSTTAVLLQTKSPLRSVENQLGLPASARAAPVAASVATRALGPAGGPASPRGTHTPSSAGIKMNTIMDSSCHNNNIGIATNIRTEPFSDFYSVEDEIGRGKFAVVKRCRHRQSGKEYAAKFLRKRRKGKDCRSDVIHEISMLEVVRKHPRLVDLVEVFETSHELIIITEYASGGELYQHVVVEERIAEKEVRRLLRQVLDGLLFLHDRNTVHLDVKPQNVLLTDRLPHGDIKLCDLGFARKVYSGEDVRDIIGTPDYVAPEVLSYEPIHTASDMWSVGVLTYVMLTGYSPFAGDTKQETFLNISQVNIDFPDDLFEDVTPLAQEFIMRLLERQPSARMTARDCLNHPWLQMLDDGCLGAARPPVSPFGSPVGQRRALTPPASDAKTLGEEPLKKCRCDNGDATSTPTTTYTDVSSTANNVIANSTTTTARIISNEEENNNLSSPVSSSSSTSGGTENRAPLAANASTTTTTTTMVVVTNAERNLSSSSEEKKPSNTETTSNNTHLPTSKVNIESKLIC